MFEPLAGESHGSFANPRFPGPGSQKKAISYPSLDFEEGAFEVVGFGAGEEDGVVGGLGRDFEDAGVAPGVGRGVGEEIEEGVGIHILTTGVGGEEAAGGEEAEGAEVEFLVAAEGAGEGVAAGGERGRVEDDEVVGGTGILAGGEPVEEVGGFELAKVGDVIALGVFLGLGDGGGGVVHAEDGGGAGAGGVEAEGALVAATVEHAAALREGGDAAVLGALVKVKAGFLRAEEVHEEFEAINGQPAGGVGLAGKRAGFEREALVAAGGGVVAEDDFLGLEKLLEGGGDVGQVAFDAGGEGLEDEGAVVLVNDEAGEVVGIGPDEAAVGAGFTSRVAAGEGGGESAVNKGAVERDGFAGVAAPGDIGFRGTEARAEEAAAGVVQDGGLAVGLGGDGGAELAVEDPGVALKDAGGWAGAEVEGEHGGRN